MAEKQENQENDPPPPPPTDPNDPTYFIEERINHIEKTLEEAEKKEEERAKEIEEKCRREIAERMAALTNQFQSAIEDRMGDVADRYRAQAHQRIAGRQTEILRANKIIREISRALGDDWRMVFQFLMGSFPKDVVKAEIEKIERQRPFIQGYKAITTWKEMKGEEFDIRQLIDALRECEKYELASHALDILDSEGDALFSITHIGGGLGQEGGGDAAEGGAEGGAPLKRQTSGGTEGYLSDTQMLKLARQLGADWMKLGKILKVPDEDLDEIEAAESGGYQAAFKMLWSWRDALEERDQQNTDVLVTALKKVNRVELAKIFEEQ